VDELARPVGLLERSVTYALGAVSDVGAEDLLRPTPCRGWNLRTLLAHFVESVDELRLDVDPGYRPVPFAVGGIELVAVFRERAGGLLGAWAGAGCADRRLPIDELSLDASTVAWVGAIEIAVHGWDVSQACGAARPMPPELATGVLGAALRLVTPDTRHPHFAARIPAPPSADPGSRLVAFLGRDPHFARRRANPR
jgi:uncharacterized protein (TIGR03086 family)